MNEFYYNKVQLGAMAPLVVDVRNHTSDEKANTLPPRHVDDNRALPARHARRS